MYDGNQGFDAKALEAIDSQQDAARAEEGKNPEGTRRGSTESRNHRFKKPQIQEQRDSKGTERRDVTSSASGLTT